MVRWSHDSATWFRGAGGCNVPVLCHNALAQVPLPLPALLSRQPDNSTGLEKVEEAEAVEIGLDWHPPGLSLTPAQNPLTPPGAGEGPGAGLGYSMRRLTTCWGDMQGASGHKARIVAEAAHTFAHLNGSTLTGCRAIQSSPPSSARCLGQDPRAVWLQRACSVPATG